MKFPKMKTRQSNSSPKPETRTFQTVDTSLWKRLEDMTSGFRCLLEHILQGCQHAGSPTSAINELADAGKPRQQPLAKIAQQTLSAAKQETWDDWYHRAVEAGVEEPVAALGKSLICKSTVQGWTAAQQADFGWYDDGQAMIDIALLMPVPAMHTWQHLLESGPAGLPKPSRHH